MRFTVSGRPFSKSLPDPASDRRFAAAKEARGDVFDLSAKLFGILSGPAPLPPTKPGLRIGILNAGASSPGMNTAVRVVGTLHFSLSLSLCGPLAHPLPARLGLNAGHRMFAIPNGFGGLLKGEISEFNWMTCNGWAVAGGSYLGANRKVLDAGSITLPSLVCRHSFENA